MKAELNYISSRNGKNGRAIGGTLASRSSDRGSIPACLVFGGGLGEESVLKKSAGNLNHFLV